MTSGIIDISVSLKRGMPVWPGSVGYDLEQVLDLTRGDPANICRITCDAHVGTHVDAPWHFLADGKTVEDLDLSVLVGRAVVVYLPEAKAIDSAVLRSLQVPADTTRLLFRTSNSELWKKDEKEFCTDFVALTADGARWIVEHEIELVGVDYLSVQRYKDSCATHEILLGANVVVIEGLNLADIAPGAYELTCLPLKIVGGDGAPARAILRPIESRRS